MGISWLDVTLGLRMLPKHPVTTLAAVFALSVGIPVSTVPILLDDARGAPFPRDPQARLPSRKAERQAGYALAQWTVHTVGITP